MTAYTQEQWHKHLHVHDKTTKAVWMDIETLVIWSKLTFSVRDNHRPPSVQCLYSNWGNESFSTLPTFATVSHDHSSFMSSSSVIPSCFSLQHKEWCHPVKKHTASFRQPLVQCWVQSSHSAVVQMFLNCFQSQNSWQIINSSFLVLEPCGDKKNLLWSEGYFVCVI